jgi:DNA-binding NtrC family response regulator
LVVDDEMDFAQVLAERLQGRGYDATACCSGKETIAKMVSGPIDVVVLDVMMPENGRHRGLAFDQKCQTADGSHPAFRRSNPGDGHHGIQQGAFEYLTKLCNANTMTRKIDEAHQHKKEHENRIRTAMAEADAIARHDAGK